MPTYFGSAYTTKCTNKIRNIIIFYFFFFRMESLKNWSLKESVASSLTSLGTIQGPKTADLEHWENSGMRCIFHSREHSWRAILLSFERETKAKENSLLTTVTCGQCCPSHWQEVSTFKDLSKLTLHSLIASLRCNVAGLHNHITLLHFKTLSKPAKIDSS